MLDTNANVLIIDDDEDVAELMRQKFVDENFNVEIQLDGDAASEHIKSFKPKIIVLDVRLPGKDGRTILSEIPEPKPITFAISGFDDVEGSALYDLGAKVFFRKPFAMNDVVAAAKSHIKDISHNSNPPIKSLTKRENEILHFISNGLSSKKIAEKLNISHRTIEKHRQNIRNKYNGKTFLEICKDI